MRRLIVLLIFVAMGQAVIGCSPEERKKEYEEAARVLRDEVKRFCNDPQSAALVGKFFARCTEEYAKRLLQKTKDEVCEPVVCVTDEASNACVSVYKELHSEVESLAFSYYCSEAKIDCKKRESTRPVLPNRNRCPGTFIKMCEAQVNLANCVPRPFYDCSQERAKAECLRKAYYNCSLENFPVVDSKDPDDSYMNNCDSLTMPTVNSANSANAEAW